MASLSLQSFLFLYSGYSCSQAEGLEMQLALRFIGEHNWLLIWLLQTSPGPVLSGCELKIADLLWVGKAQALGCFCCLFRLDVVCLRVSPSIFGRTR